VQTYRTDPQRHPPSYVGVTLIFLTDLQCSLWLGWYPFTVSAEYGAFRRNFAKAEPFKRGAYPCPFTEIR